MRKLKGFTGLVVLSACLVSATSAGADVVTDWNAQILLYSNVGNAALVPPIPVGRPGPPGLLDIALAHVAIHDAVQAIEGKFQPYSYSDSSKLGVGSSAAAALQLPTGCWSCSTPGSSRGWTLSTPPI